MIIVPCEPVRDKPIIFLTMNFKHLRVNYHKSFLLQICIVLEAVLLNSTQSPLQNGHSFEYTLTLYIQEIGPKVGLSTLLWHYSTFEKKSDLSLIYKIQMTT